MQLVKTSSFFPTAYFEHSKYCSAEKVEAFWCPFCVCGHFWTREKLPIGLGKIPTVQTEQQKHYEINSCANKPPYILRNSDLHVPCTTKNFNSNLCLEVVGVGRWKCVGFRWRSCYRRQTTFFVCSPDSHVVFHDCHCNDDTGSKQWTTRIPNISKR